MKLGSKYNLKLSIW